MRIAILALLALLMLAVAVVGQEEQLASGAGITPDRPVLYGLELAAEKIKLVLTFGKVKKIEVRLGQAEERLAELQLMADANKTAAAERAELARSKTVAAIEAEAKALEEKGRMPANVKAKVLAMLQKHIDVLNKMREKLTERGLEARGIESAIAKSSAVLEKMAAKPGRS